MRKVICDRCGKELVEFNELNVGYTSVYIDSAHSNALDLCVGCKKEFEAVNASAKLRYKKEILDFINSEVNDGKDS